MFTIFSLRNTFAEVVLANSNKPEKRFRMCPSKRKISELPEDSTRIFKRNMLDLYFDCPDSVFRHWRFSVLN